MIAGVNSREKVDGFFYVRWCSTTSQVDADDFFGPFRELSGENGLEFIFKFFRGARNPSQDIH